MILWLLLYTVACIGLAWFNARLIAQGKRIYHFWNGLFHAVNAALLWWLMGWQYGVISLLLARVVFDTSLNLFRGLPIGYVPLRPKSITDQVEQKIFESNGYLPKLLYILFIIILFVV